MTHLTRRMAPLAIALLLAALAATPAQAQAGAVFAVVAAGDAMEQRALLHLNAALVFLDGDRDGRVDAAEPVEPVYLDADGSKTVTYGDLRITGFSGYAAGTTVDLTNLDVGREVTTASGWFAATSGSMWFVDLDASRSVSPGDVRLSGAFGSRIGAGDPERGAGLEPAYQQVTSALHAGVVDLDGDGVRDAAEPVYLDLDPNGSFATGRVSVGDLRFTPIGPGLDNAPSRAEYDALLEQAGLEAGEAGSVRAARGQASDAPSALQAFLLALGLVNLVGLVMVGLQVRNAARLRNPFK